MSRKTFVKRQKSKRKKLRINLFRDAVSVFKIHPLSAISADDAYHKLKVLTGLPDMELRNEIYRSKLSIETLLKWYVSVGRWPTLDEENIMFYSPRNITETLIILTRKS